jgi:EmrB/QacA subfamily drug resistance transporter
MEPAGKPSAESVTAARVAPAAADAPVRARSETAAPERGGDRARLVAYLVAAVFFVQLLDGTILATSLPQMAASLGTDPVALGVGFTVYLLTMAALIPPAGWLADRLGEREVLTVAILGFAAASAACAAAGNLTEFVLARAAQGSAAALMMPVGRNLVLRSTPKSGVMQAIAIITWPALTAPVVGPIIGGWITTHFGWQWNLYVNVPICLVAAALFLFLVPSRPRPARRPFDWRGFLFVSGGMVLAIAGLQLFVDRRPAVGAALFAAGILLGWLSVRHLRRHPAPLFDLGVLDVRSFALATLSAGTFGRVAINATPFLLPLLLQVGYGLSPVETGSLVLVYFLGNLAMKPLTTPIMRRFGFRRVLIVNGFLAALSIGAFAVIPQGFARPALLGLLFVAGLTRSMQFTALNTLTFADIGAEQRAAATTLSTMFQQASMVLGIALSVAAIRIAQLVSGDGDGVAHAIHFRAALAAMALIGAASAARFWELHPQTGDEVAGRTGRPLTGGRS